METQNLRNHRFRLVVPYDGICPLHFFFIAPLLCHNSPNLIRGSSPVAAYNAIDSKWFRRYDEDDMI